VMPGGANHDVFAAASDIEDGADHTMVNAYAVSRPDGTWSVMLVNRDQETPHKVKISFDGAAGGAGSFAGTVKISTFGREQYQWHPSKTHFMAHAANAGDPSVMANGPGHADPDGPANTFNVMATQDTAFDLPASSVTVVSGKISGAGGKN